MYLPSVGPVDSSCLVEDSLVSFTGSTLVLSSGIGSITTHTHTHTVEDYTLLTSLKECFLQ